jgi:3-oxo-5alpha-steroid 4-dehydrogenase
MMLERASSIGGASAMAGGEIYLGGGTPIQKACGFHDTPEEMAKFLMAALGPHADADRIGLYSADSVEHFHWLVDQGVPFKAGMWDEPAWVPPTDDGLMWMGENSYPFCEVAVPAPRGHRPQHDGHGGWLLMDRLGARVAETDIDLRCDVFVDCLIVDDDRQVIGVIARQFGEEVAIRARKGVVLCAGGFVFNDEMLDEHAPQLLGHRKVGTDGDDGRGIRMAQAVGAAVRHMGAAQASLTVPIQLLVRSALVNRVGQRFINEDTYGGLVGQAALFGERGGPVYLILDEEAYESVPEPERLGRVPAAVTETLEELEREIGLPAGSLQSTIGFYNEHAERGEDPLFHKRARFLRPLRPPFGAIDVCARQIVPGADHGAVENTGFGVFTTGGLATTLDGEVLDLDGRTVPGLYAAGRTTAGIQAWGYISGTSLGDGTFFGRRAGIASAARVA